MFVSLSAVNSHSTDAALRCFIAMLKTQEFEFEASFLRKLNLWQDEAREFCERFKMLRPFNTAIRLLVAGRDVTKHKDVADAIDAVFAKLKEIKPAVDRETDVTRAQLSMLNDVRLAYGGSEAASKRLMRNVSSLRDPDLNEMFLHIEEASEDLRELYSSLRALVKKYGKVDGYDMPVDVLKSWQDHNKAKGTKLKQHEEYLALRRDVNAAYKKQLANIVRSSGQHYLPVREVKQMLGDIVNPIPETFVGNIDDLGNYYTVSGRKLLQTPSGIVKMNPAYDPEQDNTYVCMFKAPFAADYTRAYTVDYRTDRRAAKFSVVAEALPQLDSLVKKWLPDLRSAGKTKEGMLATICELVYQTSARIGSKNAKTGGETTYGMTTLQLRHIDLNDKRIIIKYIGKSAGQQKHTIKFNTQRGQLLHTALTKFKLGKKPADYLLSHGGKIATSASLNKYLQELGFPAGFTIHKVRTAKGTLLASKLLAKPPFKKGQVKDVELNRWVEQQCVEVGELLGHMSGEKVTANTAIANYIDPSVLAAVFEKYGCRPNAKIQKAIDSVGKSE